MFARREEAGTVSEVQSWEGVGGGLYRLSPASLLSSHPCSNPTVKGGLVVGGEWEVVKSLSSHPPDLPQQ